MPESYTFNGINGATGQYLTPQQTAEQLAASAQEAKKNPVERRLEAFGLPFDANPNDLATTGWGVVFAEDAPATLKEALEPLLARRRAAAGVLFHQLAYKPGETARQWLNRLGAGAGAVQPRKVPYYLLVVGSPEAIPFEFQYGLSLEYAVGRIAFETEAQYAAYATGVDAYEAAAKVAASRDIVYWATRHAGDGATQLSADFLAKPLIEGVDGEPSIAKKTGFRAQALLGDEATRGALQKALSRRKPPSLLFTASHGMGFPKDDARLAEKQGALLCQDWTGFGSIEPAHYLSAADVGDDANVSGSIAFCFACFGAGTPRTEDFTLQDGVPPQPLTDQAFVARLPQRLLSHPRGPALAIIGHVERAWGYSIRPMDTVTQVAPFTNALGALMKGQRVGHALRDFPTRYSTLSTELLADLGQELAEVPRIAYRWVARNDARNFVCIGDPAVALRIDALA